MTTRPSPEERFWVKVDRSGGFFSCWHWRASRTSDGYGQFMIRHNRIVLAHRLAYELMIGPIPTGLTIDHLCRNRVCVNPSHLEPVTVKENILRGVGSAFAINAAKTHCPQGHAYTPENTRLVEKKRMHRRCRTCEREQTRTQKEAR